MDIQELSKQLKRANPAMVYLVLGTQAVLQQEAKDVFLNLIPEEERVMNVGSYDMETTPLADALDDAMAAPFFGERRLVILNKPAFLTGGTSRGALKQDGEVLREYLKHPQPTTVLVLLAPYEKLDGRKGVVKDLKKLAVEVSAAPLDEPRARRLVEQRFQADGYQLGRGAIDELVRRTNADYGKMMAAVPVIELAVYQDKRVTDAAVAGLVPQSLDENVFDLVQAVLNHEQVEAVRLYRELLESQQAPLQINAILVSQFRLLLQIKVLSNRGLSQGTLAGQLKVHPYRVKLGLQTARRFSMDDLSHAYLGLIRCERALKSTQQDPELLFQLFLLQYTKQKVS
ncbi:DNA polymerase III subunit delta [Limosilactobacillus fermentum]|uniref:DNA polymerase III subunit delta n=1 Tax=Limosilactobacillus fermentum TaxID=1613 RepID=UPI00188094F9|nr:DNA polymerase III subunit delta [Limosilactobacillus fermentum]